MDAYSTYSQTENGDSYSDTYPAPVYSSPEPASAPVEYEPTPEQSPSTTSSIAQTSRKQYDNLFTLSIGGGLAWLFFALVFLILCIVVWVGGSLIAFVLSFTIILAIVGWAIGAICWILAVFFFVMFVFCLVVGIIFLIFGLIKKLFTPKKTSTTTTTTTTTSSSSSSSPEQFGSYA